MAGLTHTLFGVLLTQYTAQDGNIGLLQQININLGLIKNFK
jgi:hypothetical protein